MIKERVQKVCAALSSGEGAIVVSEAGRRYLTGFPSSAGIVFLTADKGYFLIDFRYIEKAQNCVDSCDVILLKKRYEQLNELISKHNIKKIYVETQQMDIASLKAYSQKLDAEVSDEDLLDRTLNSARAVKSAKELEYICQAQSLAESTFTYILDFIKAGRTEREVALEMEFFMRRAGSEGVAFEFIVVSGCNSSLPHGVPTEKPIASGDFVTMDFGAVVNGYRSDMTRTVAVNSVSDEQKKVYDTVLCAQKSAIAAMKEGILGKDADGIARKVIEDAGYGQYFGHSLGHSIGLETHESPSCSPMEETALKSGTVMTVEPGIYLPERFGVRIEDMVYITADGCKNLTHSPKELIIL